MLPEPDFGSSWRAQGRDLRRGLGYWLLYQNHKMAPTEQDVYSQQLADTFKNLDVAKSVHRVGLKALLVKDLPPGLNVFKQFPVGQRNLYILGSAE